MDSLNGVNTSKNTKNNDKTSNCTYFSGSNRGNRLVFLRTALHHIQQETGKTFLVSSVYESPSWGFKSHPFLNACVSIETLLSPDALLEKLVSIEMKMGRTRSEEQTYADRCIDLDILLYEAEIISHDHLKIPHPRLHLRNFVLYPLAEIHPNGMHPQFQKTIQTLQKESPDTALPQKYERPALEYSKPFFEPLSVCCHRRQYGRGQDYISAENGSALQDCLFLKKPF